MKKAILFFIAAQILYWSAILTILSPEQYYMSGLTDFMYYYCGILSNNAEIPYYLCIILSIINLGAGLYLLNIIFKKTVAHIAKENPSLKKKIGKSVC